MTTTVIVHAHCSADKKVRVQIADEGEFAQEFFLSDGETAERYAYDGREISVREVAVGDDPGN